jgi:heat shock protein HslJ
MREIAVRLRWVVVAGACLAFVVGCSSNPPSSSAPSAAPSSPLSPLANTEWGAGTIFGRAIPSGTSITLNFAIAKAGGFSGCNQYSVPYATEDTGLRFGPIAGTRALCGEALDAVETAYYTNLGLVTHYQVTGDALTMTSGTGETVLTYARLAPATVDGPWNITSVNNGTGGVESVPTGVSATISFLPDNLVSGFGGCNDYSSDYLAKASGDISFGPFMSQMKACGDPADSFEGKLLTALPASTKWAVTNGTLELRDSSGALQVQATSAIGH